jgi:hypothetical protein
MKPKPFLLLTVAAAATIGLLATPDQSSGQSDPQAQALNTLLAEVAAQQTVILENHTKIDEKLNAVGEEIRLARIYSGRGGGGGKTK